MNKLKTILEEDLSKKTKPQLIELLSGIQKAITPDNYGKVSDVAIADLNNYTKKDLAEIVDSFKTNYDPEWEKSLAKLNDGALKEVLNLVAADRGPELAPSASSADFAAELGSIDFAKIIGGPLDACVKAQTNASVATVSFINEVGFEVTDATTGEKKLRMADFKYKKNVPNPKYKSEEETPDEEPTIEEEVEINVPFIALLNVPSFRIESCDIDFNVKLKSTYTQNVNSEFGMKTNFSTGSGGLTSLFTKVSFNVEVAYKRTSSTGIKIEKEYSLGVKVRATNDEMPAGLEKVLGLLAS